MSKKKPATQGKPWSSNTSSKGSKSSFNKNSVVVRRPPRHQGR